MANLLLGDLGRQSSFGGHRGVFIAGAEQARQKETEVFKALKRHGQKGARFVPPDNRKDWPADDIARFAGTMKFAVSLIL